MMPLIPQFLLDQDRQTAATCNGVARYMRLPWSRMVKKEYTLNILLKISRIYSKIVKMTEESTHWLIL